MGFCDLHFDSLKLVKDKQRLSGELAVAALSRLAESLPEQHGVLVYRIEGMTDRHARPLLWLHVNGTVRLQCQRCMELFEHALDIDSAVRLVALEVLDQAYDADASDPDEPDCVAASKNFDLAALIEDEVLLTLPAHPRHTDGRCNMRADDPVAQAKITAFSVLQTLKQK